MQVSEAGAQALREHNTEAVTAVAPTISQEERKVSQAERLAELRERKQVEGRKRREAEAHRAQALANLYHEVQAGGEVAKHLPEEAIQAIQGLPAINGKPIILSDATIKAIELYQTIERLYDLTNDHHEYIHGIAGTDAPNAPYYEAYTEIGSKIEGLISESIAMRFSTKGNYIQI